MCDTSLRGDFGLAQIPALLARGSGSRAGTLASLSRMFVAHTLCRTWRRAEQDRGQPEGRRGQGARHRRVRMRCGATPTLDRHWIVVGYYLRNSSLLLITWRAVTVDLTTQPVHVRCVQLAHLTEAGLQLHPERAALVCWRGWAFLTRVLLRERLGHVCGHGRVHAGVGRFVAFLRGALRGRPCGLYCLSGGLPALLRLAHVM